jgi:hypothetical protein
MGKGHRDNHKARKKRGKVAFDKKAKRRALPLNKGKCNICGNVCRKIKMKGDLCSKCFAEAIVRNNQKDK